MLVPSFHLFVRHVDPDLLLHPARNREKSLVRRNSGLKSLTDSVKSQSHRMVTMVAGLGPSSFARRMAPVMLMPVEPPTQSFSSLLLNQGRR